MTTAPPSPVAGPLADTFDVSDTPRVPFTRLVAVEARKMRDTRAGFWLLLVTGVLLMAAAAITLVVSLANDIDVNPDALLQIMAVPLSLLLPVFAITTVTAEWSQRTGLSTFSLEPHRMRLLLAKLVAVVGLALTTIVVAMVIGAITNLLYGALAGSGADWSISGSVLAWGVVSQLLFFVMAFGFGLCFLNTPTAIAVYYVVALLLPFMVYGPIYGLVGWGPDVIPWLDLGFALEPLLMGEDGTGEIYGQVAVTTAIWVGLPLLLGLLRVRRAEIK